jgi:hypothetical protein
MAGGIGWISLGTTTRSRPRTRIAPALLAVPALVKKPTKKGKNPDLNSIPSSSLSASFSKSAWAQEPEDNVVRGKKKVTYHNNLWQRTK